MVIYGKGKLLTERSLQTQRDTRVYTPLKKHSYSYELKTEEE